MRESLLALSLSVFVHGTAAAAIITECGSSSGHEYFFPGTIVPKDKSGWHKGAISSGQIILLIESGKPRLIFRDAAGMIDTASEGAITQILGRKNGVVAVLIIYPGGAVENYLFRLDESGAGELVYGTFKWGGIIQKAAMFRAECRSPAR